ncbi:hypothetical protein [Amycolatopsis sp. WAC 01375]|uniref:hypothetical protein n=1 Tax=Amycolatopsis sp. WAC 01375 TaxID=2203194 RepID=UPI001F3D7D68|nr:hypothetical protein [Amycolatopsis sp. WAC 01375]
MNPTVPPATDKNGPMTEPPAADTSGSRSVGATAASARAEGIRIVGYSIIEP